MLRVIFVRGVLLLGLTFVISSGAGASILPPNNLYLQDSIGKRSNMTEAQFTQVLERAKAVFTPIVAAHGGSFNLTGSWEDSTVNANASQRFGSWNVTMYGGLARRDEINEDAFTLVLCHEIGHHLAGFPFVSQWSSDEGQSDYFSTMHCPKLMWGDAIERNAAAEDTVDEIPRAKCDAVWTSSRARQLCYRTMNAGKNLANLIATIKQETVDFSAEDLAEVVSTYDGHPAAQCRLDTYIAGALCRAKYNPSVIPGKRDGRGYNDAEAEQDAARYSCTESGGQTVGLRPRCWFRPTL